MIAHQEIKMWNLIESCVFYLKTHYMKLVFGDVILTSSSLNGSSPSSSRNWFHFVTIFHFHSFNYSLNTNTTLPQISIFAC